MPADRAMKTPTPLDRCLLSAAVAASVVLSSVPAVAAPGPEPVPAETETDDLARSRALFEEGLRAYEAEDYGGAAGAWTEAHMLMAGAPELAAGRRVLGFDLAQAHMRAFERDHDCSRLSVSKPLLDTYVAWVDRPQHTMDEAEREDRQRAVELLAQIERESCSAPADPVPPPRVVQPTPAPPPSPAPQEPLPSGRGLLIGGGLAVGGGLAAIAGVVVGQAKGKDAERRYNAAQQAQLEQGSDAAARDADAANRDGRRANALILTSAAAVLGLTTAGITMLAVGAHRRKRYISASAAVTPTGAGGSFAMRF